jgi:hypothetical protein
VPGLAGRTAQAQHSPVGARNAPRPAKGPGAAVAATPLLNAAGWVARINASSPVTLRAVPDHFDLNSAVLRGSGISNRAWASEG